MNKGHVKSNWNRNDILGCILSASLLILAFPKTNFSIFAWIGLVPLLLVLDGKKPMEAFRWAYFCGLMFFAGTLFWFFHITQWFSYIAAVGVSLLFAYLALYFGLFGFICSWFSPQKSIFKLFLLPSVWVILEYARAHVFTGFDWASLGHSQYQNLPVIQIADMTGVFGVSFIIVMVNVFLKELISASFIEKTAQAQKRISVLSAVTVVIVISVLSYGMRSLSSKNSLDQTEGSLSVAVIQANISQEDKWKRSAWPNIMRKHIGLTLQAAAHDPELIIWPETSYPGYLWDDKELFIQLQELVRGIEIPILVGSVLKENGNYYNTAILLAEDGEVAQTYRKVHLVPFGEYLPLRNILPFLESLVSIGDFNAGDQWTTFSSPSDSGKGRLFSVLICFEDTVSRLSRKFVQNGAGLLVNMTNDAWFEDTKAPFMHLQSSVFRTIENRRGLIRAANTGVSCFIDRWGRINHFLERKQGAKMKKTYVSGYAIQDVQFNQTHSFYTKFGDIFTFFCFGFTLLGLIINTKRKT